MICLVTRDLFIPGYYNLAPHSFPYIALDFAANRFSI